MIYRTVIFNALKSFNEVFDDANIKRNQVMYWALVVVNRLRVDQYKKTESGIFISTFSSVVVVRDNKGRQYFDLPAMIMDLPNEGGVEYITYNIETGCCCDGDNFSQIFFQPTTPSKSHRLYGDEYEKPSTTNPYFYRIGDKHDGVKVDRIYLVGTDCIEIKDVEIALLATLDPKTICSLDDVIPLPDEREQELMQGILEIGRFVMMMPKERINDGTEEKGATPQTQVPSAIAQDQTTEE